ncbi:5-dehydro-4-deoxy-D-glucuronate isomerase [Asticcacaulis sp. EMRT-3]|uniref:5-dehydro-4-deoxy-D-glucuronate isomerase n=1 Tax=Asticcacaulis sp. EMRT-3 TaxID=3040349 RepID=UPI0024AFEC5C|nr:5-dehydro-4-deoxy-D-glucuronate isomerase [Asticcacaulis sp. EMRT-3]MDI7773924.1 5-dehydro-4-deoxy-D-glucuronate isomerase [Asticcacaulis sp. EMRT-3]
MFRSTYYAGHPATLDSTSTAALRDQYLIRDLFAPGAVVLTYVHQERMIIGSASPLDGALDLPHQNTGQPLLARRELGVINIGEGAGIVRVDGVAYRLAPLDAVYVGRGAQAVRFESVSVETPARFYLASTPAHAAHPGRHIARSEAVPLKRGEQETSNDRLIYQFIVPDTCASAQLMMGLTLLRSGNVWNTMPPHTHERRSEVYFYFNMAADAPLFHFMGRPDETRHIVVRNEQAVICPPWSLHMGVGVTSYAFIWAMGGENLDYDDMEGLDLAGLL